MQIVVGTCHWQTGGFFGLPGRTAYAAAKHAAVGFYDALRAEVSERGVEAGLGGEGGWPSLVRSKGHRC